MTPAASEAIKLGYGRTHSHIFPRGRKTRRRNKREERCQKHSLSLCIVAKRRKVTVIYDLKERRGQEKTRSCTSTQWLGRIILHCPNDTPNKITRCSCWWTKMRRNSGWPMAEIFTIILGRKRCEQVKIHLQNCWSTAKKVLTLLSF